jgi:hypothetical protein
MLRLAATQESIALFATYSRLSKRPSSNTVEMVRWRHFAASLARAASACCTRCSASTPRTRRSGTSCFRTCFGRDHVGHVQLHRNFAFFWKFDGPIERVPPYVPTNVARVAPKVSLFCVNRCCASLFHAIGTRSSGKHKLGAIFAGHIQDWPCA